LIAAGRVTVNKKIATSRATPVSPDDTLEVDAGPRFVGRGGYKLCAALSAFEISVVGKVCLDVGSSTGGFTDCLLQEGASGVVAVDVGRDQLAAELRHDPRVREMQATDIRSLGAADIGGPFPFVVVDVSFISVARLAETIAGMTAPGGEGVILVKPQFEVGREAVGRGVVRAGEERETALLRVVSAFVHSGFDSLRAMESPVVGEAGNREYFLWMRKR
jgi:23S rRNA (cytidine1920-2'-O)/16S rRNA (cytidine1409-2'-O)-methyltransferase